MRYGLFAGKAQAYVCQVLSFGTLGYGSYRWHRAHGNALWLALALLAGMLLAQRGFRHMTNFGLQPWIERCGLIFLFGAALWFDALVPHLDAQANIFVAAVLALCGMFVLLVLGGAAALIVALIRRKI